MYHIIVNSKRVRGKRAAYIDTVKAVFERAGKQICFHFTEYAGHAKAIAEELTREEKKISIIAMGGDGTLHEVLNGLRDPSLCRLGVIPIGSGNDFAAAVGIPENNIKYAAQIIAFRSPTFIDYIDISGGLRSINVLGCGGMDVDILNRAYSAHRNGKSKYIYGFFSSLFRYKPVVFGIRTDDGEMQTHKGLVACLGNGRQIGNGIKLFPAAKVDDGYMDVLIIEYSSTLKTFAAFLKLFLGKVDSVKAKKIARCKKAEIFPEGKICLQAEGELYDAEGGIFAQIVSGKLKFYLPHAD